MSTWSDMEYLTCLGKARVGQQLVTVEQDVRGIHMEPVEPGRPRGAQEAARSPSSVSKYVLTYLFTYRLRLTTYSLTFTK